MPGCNGNLNRVLVGGTLPQFRAKGRELACLPIIRAVLIGKGGAVLAPRKDEVNVAERIVMETRNRLDEWVNPRCRRQCAAPGPVPE